MEKSKLENYLKDNLSYRKIATLERCSPKKVEYWVNKHSIKFLAKYNKEYQKNVDHNFFNKIDTKEKAYIVGFIMGDGYISDKLDVYLGLAIKDKQLIYDIDNYIPWECIVKEDLTFDKKTKRFPRVRFGFRSRNFGKNLIKYFGNRLASERNTPIVPKHYEKYLLAGFFDADGCITFGERKDRNKKWQKISFTASDTILIGVQKILLKHEISTIIKPKKDEKVFIIEFAAKKDIIKFANLLPIDGIRLKRKVIKLNDLILKIN